MDASFDHGESIDINLGSVVCARVLSQLKLLLTGSLLHIMVSSRRLYANSSCPTEQKALSSVECRIHTFLWPCKSVYSGAPLDCKT